MDLLRAKTPWPPSSATSRASRRPDTIRKEAIGGQGMPRGFGSAGFLQMSTVPLTWPVSRARIAGGAARAHERFKRRINRWPRMPCLTPGVGLIAALGRKILFYIYSLLARPCDLKEEVRPARFGEVKVKSEESQRVRSVLVARSRLVGI